MRRINGKNAGLLLMAICLAGAPLAAVMAQQEQPTFNEAVADTLQPGEYRWNPDAAPEGSLSILVSLQRQVAYVYRGGTLIGVTNVSTGRAGHETPTGVFTVLEKQVQHRSTLYNSAPMPFMQRLTWDGVAIHAGTTPGQPSSHGCVHVPVAFAKLLYGATRVGVTVSIQDDVTPAIGQPAVSEDVAQADRSADTGDPARPAVQLAGYSVDTGR